MKINYKLILKNKKDFLESIYRKVLFKKRSNKILREKNYFTIRGGSLKKIAKKMIPNVPINKNV
jgi:hypothetical protein